MWSSCPRPPPSSSPRDSRESRHRRRFDFAGLAVERVNVGVHIVANLLLRNSNEKLPSGRPSSRPTRMGFPADVCRLHGSYHVLGFSTYASGEGLMRGKSSHLRVIAAAGGTNEVEKPTPLAKAWRCAKQSAFAPRIGRFDLLGRCLGVAAISNAAVSSPGGVGKEVPTHENMGPMAACAEVIFPPP